VTIAAWRQAAIIGRPRLRATGASWNPASAPAAPDSARQRMRKQGWPFPAKPR